MKNIIDLREQYVKVVNWNIKAGNLPDTILPSNIHSQKALVQEELQELVDEFVNKGSQEDFLKELADVFIVISYLDFLQTMEVDEYISPEACSQIALSKFTDRDFLQFQKKPFGEFIEEMDNFHNLKFMVYILKKEDIDFAAILDSVLDNNDLKLYTDLAKADMHLVELGEEGYRIETNTCKGVNYYTVRRESDNKIMKPKDLPKVDIRSLLDSTEERS